VSLDFVFHAGVCALGLFWEEAKETQRAGGVGMVWENRSEGLVGFGKRAFRGTR